MSMEIVTGSTGEAHVTPVDDAVRNSHVAKISEQVVFDVPITAAPERRAFYAEVITVNEVWVYAGYGSNHGRLFKINEDDHDVARIKSGKVNIKRMDLISARYERNAVDDTESISLYTIEGEEGSDYVRPTAEIRNDNINSLASGNIVNDFILYEVYINGQAIDHITPCFTPLPDGGLIGIALNRMAEIEADLERVPFDLGDAVNKTYVDNALVYPTSVCESYTKNLLSPFEDLDDGIHGYLIQGDFLFNGYPELRKCMVEICPTNTKTLNSITRTELGKVQLYKGTYRLYISDPVCYEMSQDLTTELKEWAQTFKFFLKKNNSTKATVTLLDNDAEFTITDEEEGLYSLYCENVSGKEVLSTDGFIACLNVCDAVYKGFASLSNILTAEEVTKKFIQNGQPIDVTSNGVLEFCGYSDTRKSRLVIDASNSTAKRYNYQEDQELYDYNDVDFLKLRNAKMLKITARNCNVYYADLTYGKSHGIPQDTIIVLMFADANGKLGYRVLKILYQGSSIEFNLSAVTTITTGFTPSETMGIDRIQIVNNYIM